MPMQIHQATISDLHQVAPLFDSYRQFYEKPSDLEAARVFLSERFKNDQSIIFLANTISGEAVGFTQLFPSFSSVSMARTFILNDLFVVPGARRGGVGTRLLAAAVQYGRAAGALRITLSTAIDNNNAKALYLSQGWKQDEAFDVFHLAL
jgi:GNAT superfamily N-acetyltransferase